MKRSTHLLSGAQLSPLKLKLAFISLGLFLLAGLVFLSLTIEARLQEARRDREEMVALRVFDELEREVSVFLDSEAARPAYDDLTETDPRSWAPFVVGYFREGQHSRQRVAADGPTSENKRRIDWAIEQVLGPSSEKGQKEELKKEQSDAPLLESAEKPSAGSRSVEPSLQPGKPSAKMQLKLRPKPKPKPQPKAAKKASSASIIEQLNRAPSRRKIRPQSPQKKKAAPKDPFTDYAEKF